MGEQQKEQSLETRVKELIDENRLLFDQLHIVQEELEKYYNTSKDSEQKIKDLTEENAKLIEQNKKLEKAKEQEGGEKNVEQRVKDLTEKNTKLLEQLQVAQESLEKYAYRLKDYEEEKGKNSELMEKSNIQITNQVVARLVDAERLRVFAEQQKIAYNVEKQNSRSSRLWNMVLKSSLLAIPGKLLTTWRSLEKTTPPSSLGGKTFQKLIDLYQEKGNEAVEQMLDKVGVSYIIRANAYTALARHLSKKAPDKTAEFARLAWETDPQPYRMKWLAHRVYEAGDAATAEALLDMLPSDLSRTSSEERQEERIHLEAAVERERLIQQEFDVVDQHLDAQKVERITKENEAKKKEMDFLKKRLDQSIKESEARKKKADELQVDLAEAKQQLKAREEQAMTALNAQLVEAQNLVEKHRRDMDALNAQLVEAQGLAEKNRQDMVAAEELLSESQELADARQRENIRLQQELNATKQLIKTSGLSLEALHTLPQEKDSRNQAWMRPQGIPPLDTRFAVGQGMQGQESVRLQEQQETMQRVYQNCLLQLTQQLAQMQQGMASPGYTGNRFSPENIPSYFDTRLREAQELATEWQQESYRLQMQNDAMQKVYQNALLQAVQQLAEAKSLSTDRKSFF